MEENKPTKTVHETINEMLEEQRDHSNAVAGMLQSMNETLERTIRFLKAETEEERDAIRAEHEGDNIRPDGAQQTEQ